jgi:hypothetical protein
LEVALLGLLGALPLPLGAESLAMGPLFTERPSLRMEAFLIGSPLSGIAATALSSGVM